MNPHTCHLTMNHLIIHRFEGARTEIEMLLVKEFPSKAITKVPCFI